MKIKEVCNLLADDEGKVQVYRSANPVEGDLDKARHALSILLLAARPGWTQGMEVVDGRIRAEEINRLFGEEDLDNLIEKINAPENAMKLADWQLDHLAETILAGTVKRSTSWGWNTPEA
ncbi:hypothetical protein KKC94_04855 [Patescibacteria group bacterium]|nr:hypothetical protein [Patescibacteria group bacterium]